ncbi:MFS transporter [Streptosporangium sp. NPDC001559]|uniref:MFS transporter n=1 Tax=Streptosporangium sp. NPDC001559 TaxID=3366187 RepID=UPI0036E2D97C
MTDEVLAPTVGAQEGMFSRTYAVATLSFSAVTVLTGLAALAVVPILPIAVRDLQALELYSLAASVFVAASLLGGVIGGNWADRVGAGRPLAAGLALAVVTLLVSATSTSIWQLAAGRFLDGIAAGMVAVTINTAIGQTYPDWLRPRVLALMAACWIGPSLVGPPLAGLIADWWSWRGVFYGLAALTLLPAAALVIVLRGSSRTATSAEPGDEAGRPGLIVAAAVSLGAALAQYAISDWNVQHLILGLVGLVLVVAFVRRMVPPGTWRAMRGLPATVLLNGLACGTFFTLEAFVPLLLDSARQVPPAATGLVFTGAAVAWAASSWVQSRWLANRPRHHLIATGALLMGAATVTAAVGALPVLPAYIAGASLIIAAIGMGTVAPTLTVLSLAHAPYNRQGYASSSMQTSMNLGQVAIMAASSALFSVGQNTGSTPVSFGAAFGLLVVPSVLVALLAVRARSA